MDDVEEINSDNECGEVEIVDSSIKIPEYFHYEGKNPNVIVGVDETIRAISFPIRQNFVWKGYIGRRNATSGQCLICDESIVIQPTNPWAIKIHIMQKHPHCCDYKNLCKYNKTFVAQKKNELGEAN